MGNKHGFTLAEVLLVIVIVSILALVALILLNPLEETRKGRDSIRLSDINLIFKAITLAIDAAGEPSPSILCAGSAYPCMGSSIDQDPNVRKNDGTGWVKVNLGNVSGITLPILPVDPQNNGLNNYSYYSTGLEFELNMIFESTFYKDKMAKDGGNNNQKYELGTRLNLMN